LKEKKTGKNRRITLNKPCMDAIRRLLESTDYEDGDPLFRSSKEKAPLTVPSVHRLVKSWCRNLTPMAT
jgi:integrase